MARLIYSAIMSLDGYIADADGRFERAAPDEEVHAFVNDLERPVGTYSATARRKTRAGSTSRDGNGGCRYRRPAGRRCVTASGRPALRRICREAGASAGYGAVRRIGVCGPRPPPIGLRGPRTPVPVQVPGGRRRAAVLTGPPGRRGLPDSRVIVPRCEPDPTYGHGHGDDSVRDGHHGHRHQEPRPVDSYLAHAARRPYVGKEFVEDLG